MVDKQQLFLLHKFFYINNKSYLKDSYIKTNLKPNLNSRIFQCTEDYTFIQVYGGFCIPHVSTPYTFHSAGVILLFIQNTNVITDSNTDFACIIRAFRKFLPGINGFGTFKIFNTILTQLDVNMFIIIPIVYIYIYARQQLTAGLFEMMYTTVEIWSYKIVYLIPAINFNDTPEFQIKLDWLLIG